METQATFKYVRSAPRKVRLVVNTVRGKSVSQALNILKFARKMIARDVYKLIRSAQANAEKKGGARMESLYVKKICVNTGPIMHRIMARAKGSASDIKKRMSHITVVLDERI